MDKQLTRMIIAGVVSGGIIVIVQGLVRAQMSRGPSQAGFTPRSEFYT